MARAYNIYVVTKGGRPYSSFTVKRECKEWLKNRYEGPDAYQVFVQRDGGGYITNAEVWSGRAFLDR